jgi:hypothetical protein
MQVTPGGHAVTTNTRLRRRDDAQRLVRGQAIVAGQNRSARFEPPFYANAT